MVYKFKKQYILNTMSISSTEKIFIDEDDLKSVKEAKNKLQIFNLSLKNAELEYRNLVLNIFLKNGLSLTDSFDEQTGKIIIKQVEKENS
jgi:hypothetical protein